MLDDCIRSIVLGRSLCLLEYAACLLIARDGDRLVRAILQDHLIKTHTIKIDGASESELLHSITQSNFVILVSDHCNSLDDLRRQ